MASGAVPIEESYSKLGILDGNTHLGRNRIKINLPEALLKRVLQECKTGFEPIQELFLWYVDHREKQHVRLELSK